MLCYFTLMLKHLEHIFHKNNLNEHWKKNAIIHVERPLSKDSFAHTTMEFKSITFYACDQLSGESTKTIIRKKVFSRKQSNTYTDCPMSFQVYLKWVIFLQNESNSYWDTSYYAYVNQQTIKFISRYAVVNREGLDKTTKKLKETK